MVEPVTTWAEQTGLDVFLSGMDCFIVQNNTSYDREEAQEQVWVEPVTTYS